MKSGKKLMTFWIVRRFYDINAAKFIGIERETKIQKFFHDRAFDRRKKNTILGLWNYEGKWCDDKGSILATTLAYFEKIYTTISPSGIQEITNAIPT